jgi:Flp pilus assembly protein TadD
MLARVIADRDELVVSIRIRRGNLYQRLGRQREALDEYAEALRIWPNNWTVYRNRNWFHEKAGEIELARADYRKAATLKPPDDWLVRALDRTR